jgi:hypothetical protein
MECAICLDAMTDNIIRLSCSHEYHTACIHAWMARERTCPMCRDPIKPTCWGRVMRRLCALVYMFVGDSHDRDPSVDYIYF